MSEQPGYGFRQEGEPPANPQENPPGGRRYFPPRSASRQPQSPAQPPLPAGGIPQVPSSEAPEPQRYQQPPQMTPGAPRPAAPPQQSFPRASQTPRTAESYPHDNPAPEPVSRRSDSFAAGDHDAPASVYGTIPDNAAAPPSNFTVSPSRSTVANSPAVTSPAADTASPSTPTSPREVDDNPPEPKSSRRSPLWLLYGLVILVLIALVCWQIVRLSTGKVPSAVPLGSQAGATEAVAAPEPKPIATTQTEQVKKVLAAQPVTPAQLGGDKKRVTFRSQSGIVVCTIAEKLEDTPPPLVPLAADSSSALASGSGVVCATASNFDAAGNVGKCKQGDLRLSVLGVWDTSSGIGGCVNGTTPLYQDVKSGQTDNSGKRFDLQSLGPGQYTQLGKYACTFGGADATCVNVSTGKGFTFTDLEGYKFF